MPLFLGIIMYLETNLHLFFLPEEFLYEIAKMHESKPVFLMEGRALSFMLSLISPMLRFIQKSVIWFALQNLWQVSTWNTTLDWNGLTWKMTFRYWYISCMLQHAGLALVLSHVSTKNALQVEQKWTKNNFTIHYSLQHFLYQPNYIRHCLPYYKNKCLLQTMQSICNLTD